MGGFVGGLLGGGGILGGLLGGGGILGGLMGGLSGIVNNLADRFGISDVVQGITNLAGDFLQTGLGLIIDTLPIPDFMKDAAKSFVGGVIGQEQRAVPCDCQDAVNEELGDTIKDHVQSILDMVAQNMQDESDEASEGGGDGSGNWLMILAKALGKQSGEHLKSMVDKGKELGAMDSEKEPEAYAELQAEFQAASQIFKMSQEGISTMLKNLGEGMSAVARKQ